ncbi:MAG: hypothetical protein LBT12_08405 [Oscillospiraceae bacterium]|jgi:hypothetical protein|nr:hypothetical protein [Oscillospiraceae bacterium]
MLNGYNDFITELLAAGFSMGGGADEGVFAVVPFSWDERPPFPTRVRWHTGDPDTDPWEWRMRVLRERDDVAYAKLFFKKSGYVTRRWYPHFLAARRRGRTFEDAYNDGNISRLAKRVYSVIREGGEVSAHELRPRGGFSKEEKPQVNRAVLELQMGLYVTICGGQQKTARTGEGYGWNSSVFCTAERFWGEAVFDEAASLDPAEAASEIRAQIERLNPSADAKKVKKFITG